MIRGAGRIRHRFSAMPRATGFSGFSARERNSAKGLTVEQRGKVVCLQHLDLLYLMAWYGIRRRS